MIDNLDFIPLLSQSDIYICYICVKTLELIEIIGDRLALCGRDQLVRNGCVKTDDSLVRSIFVCYNNIMSEKAATKSDIKSLENRIDLRFEKIDARFEKIDERFEKIDERFEKIDERFEKINERFEKIDLHFEKMEARFDETMKVLSDFADSVNTRFNRVEERLDQHDEEFRKLNEKYDHLIETIDDFVGRINRQDIESVARDHKMARLERWIEQIAKKTGTRLE